MMISNLQQAWPNEGARIEKSWTKDNSLFKPLWYFNLQEGIELCYTIGYGRGYRGFKNVEERFIGNDLALKSFYCKPIRLIVGAGTVFLEENNVITSLIITCQDENGVTYLINNKVNEFPKLKVMMSKIIKEDTHKADYIWTNDIDSYCFTQHPKVKFKSFLDQKNYYQHLADEWLESQRKPLPKVEVQGELVF